MKKHKQINDIAWIQLKMFENYDDCFYEIRPDNGDSFRFHLGMYLVPKKKPSLMIGKIPFIKRKYKNYLVWEPSALNMVVLAGQIYEYRGMDYEET